MRILKLWLDGYGRFSQREIELAPGLQVIAGPNEQGKSTIRAFVCDMLYGQKRTSKQRSYDPNNTLRRPWHRNGVYGGRLLYRLESGRVIEVFRSFDRKNEALQVFDRTAGTEITAEFPLLGNRERAFAEEHLGVGKAVFTQIATVDHINLEALGDKDALPHIRERLLALADSASEEGSSDAAINRLKDRIAGIGQRNARTRPLPVARARLDDVNREYEAALALRQELAHDRARHHEMLEELERLRSEKSGAEGQLRALEACDRAARLEEAETLHAKIEEATRHSFEFAAVREFPLEQLPEVQRVEAALSNARAQLERSCAEQAQLEKNIEAERERLGAAADVEMNDVPEESEQRLNQLEAASARLSDRIEETEAALTAVNARLEEVEAAQESLPDFSQAPPNPIEWLSAEVSTFQSARQALGDELRKHKHLAEDVACRGESVARTAGLFAARPHFQEEARDFEVNQRVFEEEEQRRIDESDAARTAAEDYAQALPGYVWPAILSGLGVVAFLAGAYYSKNAAVLAPAGLSLLALLWFVGNMIFSRVGCRRAVRQDEAAKEALEALRERHTESRVSMEELMQAAGCESIRELEAVYDRFREAEADLARRKEALDEQTAALHQHEKQAARMFGDMRKSLELVGETVEKPSQVQDAAKRAMARYQEYRDAKRRAAEAREQAALYARETARMKSDLEDLLDEERNLSLELRKFMRENAYPEESKHDSAASALRGYRIRAAQLRQKRGRVEVLREKLAEVMGRRGGEEAELAEQTVLMERCLEAAHVETPEQWYALAEQARRYRELWAQRSGWMEQLKAVLRGQTIEQLRSAVAEDGQLPEDVEGDIGEARRQVDELANAIAEKSEEAHALNLHLAARATTSRPMNELEEERAALSARVEFLEFELEAASRAAAAIEEVAADTHARIAPRLTERAGEYLDKITGGAYGELFIDRELGVSVRLPQTSRMDSEPEKRLSKGTVDQIYLALRLAMVQALSEDGEPIPMLLDDPFANYDDVRLRRAIELLLDIAEENQLLLFTCRDDVLEAARSLGAPTLEL